MTTAAPSPISLTAVLVDDELPARLFLRELLAEHPAIRIIGEADTAERALRLIEESKPDVVFLDIRLGKHNSFNVVSQFPVPTPKIVFVTAFGQYAARAFDNSAIDYLLKPLDPARVQRTVDRLLKSVVPVDIQTVLAALAKLSEKIVGAGPASIPRPIRFVAKDGDEHLLVDLKNVISIESEGNYVYFNASERRFRVRKPINEVELALTGLEFIRVSRSLIIRGADIVSFERNFRGRLNVTMRGGKTITCTAGYREHVLRYLGI
ncbi:MAG: two-component system, LytTR family, response regulator [Gammaproteobacteria bacterium]|nr:two-component system, LytTR family, response regulator [Gammaproteobacteria bacterium]